MAQLSPQGNANSYTIKNWLTKFHICKGRWLRISTYWGYRIKRKSNYITVNDQSNIEFFIRFFLTTGLSYISNYLFFFHGPLLQRQPKKKKNCRGMHISRESLGTIFLLDQTNMLLEHYWIHKMHAGPCFQTEKKNQKPFWL